MIPKDFVDKYLEKAKGSTFFGHPIEELSRNELMACVIMCNEQHQQQIESSKRERDFMMVLYRSK